MNRLNNSQNHKSFQRYLSERQILSKAFGETVKCPICKKKMMKSNFEKYGKCWTCYMTSKIKKDKDD